MKVWLESSLPKEEDIDEESDGTKKPKDVEMNVVGLAEWRENQGDDKKTG